MGRLTPTMDPGRLWRLALVGVFVLSQGEPFLRVLQAREADHCGCHRGVCCGLPRKPQGATSHGCHHKPPTPVLGCGHHAQELTLASRVFVLPAVLAVASLHVRESDLPEPLLTLLEGLHSPEPPPPRCSLLAA